MSPTTPHRVLSALGFALLGVLALTSAAFALIGRGGPGEMTALIEPICDDSLTIETRSGAEPLGEGIGRATAYAACTPDPSRDRERVEAYVVSRDPRTELLYTGDGWESGDGTAVTWAVKPRAGRWVVVIAVGEEFDDAAFAALADDGFELSGNLSSPLFQD